MTTLRSVQGPLRHLEQQETLGANGHDIRSLYS
jgi:hypothetical protein